MITIKRTKDSPLDSFIVYDSAAPKRTIQLDEDVANIALVRDGWHVENMPNVGDEWEFRYQGPEYLDGRFWKQFSGVRV